MHGSEKIVQFCVRTEKVERVVFVLSRRTIAELLVTTSVVGLFIH